MVKECDCPKCSYPMYCGCKSCISEVPPGIKSYRWTEDGNAVICAGCGFTASEDFWFDECVRQMINGYYKEAGIDIIN